MFIERLAEGPSARRIVRTILPVPGFFIPPPVNKLFIEQIVNFFLIGPEIIEEGSKRILPIDS